ncbi:MAG: hypothetical protein ACI856_000521 [Kiritimatiellia bacterium]|jgi:hypothetical protein
MRSKQTDAKASVQLPPELTDRLQQMIRRVRRIIFVRGFMTTVVVLLACSLLIMAIDAGVMLYSSVIRWLLSLGGLAIVLATAWRSLVRPLSQPLTLTRMARVLETRHPELQERISSALELLSMGGSAGVTGSEQLIQLLVHDAKADISGVTPRKEFTGRSLKPVLVGGGVIGLIFAALFIVWPQQTSLLFARAVAPYANLSGLQGSGLKVTPGDVTCLQGDALTLNLKVSGRIRARAEVHAESATGSRTVERMMSISADDVERAEYALTYPAVHQSFRYRMRYGAGLTRYYDVKALPQPGVSRMVITSQYPAYTQRPDQVLPEGARDIVGVAGGTVTIETEFNRHAEATLLLGEGPMDGASAGKTPGATWTFGLSTNMSPKWGISLRDKHGFTNQVEWAALNVSPDRVPVVTIVSPRAPKLTLPPYGKLDITCAISEDFGVASSTLVVEPEGFNASIVELDLVLTEDGEGQWQGQAQIDMGLLDLDGATKFKAWVSVTDTLPSSLDGPQEGRSSKLEITIDSNADRIEDQLREEHKRDLVGMLKQAADQLNQAADKVTSVKSQTAVALLSAPVVEALTRAHDLAAGATDLVENAAGLSARSRFSGMTTRILYVGRQVVEPSRAATAEIAAVAPVKRPSQSAAAIATLQDAAEQVLGLIEDLEKMNKKLDEIAKVEALAQREMTLSTQAAQRKLTPEQIKAWKQEQSKISDQLAAQRKADDATAQEAQKQMDAAQTAMLKEEQKRAQEQMAQQQQSQKQQQAQAKGAKGKDGKGKDGKGKDGKGKDGKGKDGKGKGKDGKGKDGKGKGKDGKGKGEGKGKGKGQGQGQGGEPSPDAQMAAQSAAEAAQSMAQMAAEMSAQMESQIASQTAAKMPPDMKSPKASKGGKGGNSRGKGEAFAYMPEMFRGRFTGAEWARIKGNARSGALSEELQNIPPEYRELVRRYFLELANEGTRKTPSGE